MTGDALGVVFHCLLRFMYSLNVLISFLCVQMCSDGPVWVHLRACFILYWVPVGRTMFLTSFPAVVGRDIWTPRLQRLDSSWRSFLFPLPVTSLVFMISKGFFFLSGQDEGLNDFICIAVSENIYSSCVSSFVGGQFISTCVERRKQKKQND